MAPCQKLLPSFVALEASCIDPGQKLFMAAGIVTVTSGWRAILLNVIMSTCVMIGWHAPTVVILPSSYKLVHGRGGTGIVTPSKL